MNTVKELFPSNGVNLLLTTTTERALSVSVCQSCGALVGLYSQVRHTRWHNDQKPWSPKLDPDNEQRSHMGVSDNLPPGNIFDEFMGD